MKAKRKFSLKKILGIAVVIVFAGTVVLSISGFKLPGIWIFEPRNAEWGKEYPEQYKTLMNTKDTTFKSLHNNSAKTDILAKYPNVVILFAGYAFSKDYNQARGHFYALDDVVKTLRTGAPKDANDGPLPSACWTCKSPDVPRLMAQLGGGDVLKGAEEFYKGKWASKGHEMVNSIGCADCHDANTMALKITRPALIEAFKRQGKDITKATEKEMKSLVCAQCHVEYYFKGDNKVVTFPWDKGMSIEDMEKYYDEAKFKDWEHPISKAPMIKAQHPDYELFTTSIHYERGVSCADCHMPYVNNSFTDHQAQSPLAKMSQTCMKCHKQSEDVLKKNVFDRQNKIVEMRTELEDILVKAHIEAKAAWEAKATEDEMKKALTLIRQAQWRWDMAAAGHGNAFHAPLETARIIATGLSKAQEARHEITKVLFAHGVTKAVEMPDLSTKEKAQKFIGFDITKAKADKQVFLTTLVPEWLKQAKERESKYSNK